MLLLPTVLPDSALFLDFDGTLVDIAATPDAVKVPGGLVPTLAALHRQLGGALAIVTGRPIADIDHFLSPLQLPIAGEHGAQYRMADGSSPAIDQPPLEEAVVAMNAMAAQHPGLLVERKSHSVALHYRHAPELEALCRSSLQKIVAGRPGVELLYGKCVVEVKPAGVHKGQAIAVFMSAAPFAGRVPIFAGDDVTDESGFAAVQQLGGRGIKIGEGASQAQHRCLSSAALRGWLANARTTLAPLAESGGWGDAPARRPIKLLAKDLPNEPLPETPTAEAASAGEIAGQAARESAQVAGFGPPAAPSLRVGMIGNCGLSALVDIRGRIVWSCMPRFDGDPVFNALLQPGTDGTAFAIEIEDFDRSEQNYEPNTAVLRTRLYDKSGHAIEVVDFAPRFFARQRFFRPQMLVRRVRALHGSPRIRVNLDLRFDWGRETPKITRGSNHIRFVGQDMTLRLNTDAPVSHVLSKTPFMLTQELHFMLGADETLHDGIAETARGFERETIAYWQKWTQRLHLPLEWQDAVIRAAITLKMSLYEETGAIVAAMTTSIPEAPGSQRNWDYRYCWLRDAFFVVRALNSLSELGTMEDYLRWLGNVVVSARGGHVQPLYGIGMEQNLPESFVDHLAGYRGMGPVRVGNQAQEHFQHDVYGNIVLGAAQAFHDQRLLHRAGKAEFHQLEEIGEKAIAVYGTPDAGMWELRTRARIHTSSALMSWAACDRIAKIADHLKLPERAVYWHGHAKRMQEEIITKSWSEERQAFAESFGGRDLDASVLLMAEVGFIDPKDPRFIATVEAMQRSLCDGPYMRRYEAPDDFGKPETAFNICTFWLIDALTRIGRKDEARSIFETMLAARNHVGIMSEDTHPETGEMWGNFPQTYSMVGIINAAMRLSAPWDSVI